MKERPILFSAPMVRAILGEEKTQTRRILKRSTEFKGPYSSEYVEAHQHSKGWAQICPYGQPGDLLWVRETWSHTGQGVWTVADARMSRAGGKVVYRADEDTPGAGWFPSIHMPKEFVRIFLKVTDVRVQRLQDISEADAQAEGIERMKSGRGFYSAIHSKGAVHIGIWHSTAREAFRDLWDSINGEGSWDKNPWVYALTFERIQNLNAAA